jgi:hypothetical protein
MAASKGDLIALQTMVDKAKQKDKIVNPPVQNNNNNDNKNYDGGGFHHRNLRILLNTSDRHKSIADHWAAGCVPFNSLLYRIAIVSPFFSIIAVHITLILGEVIWIA